MHKESKSRTWLKGRGGQAALLITAITAATYAGNTLSPLEETVRVALSWSDNQMGLLQGPALAFPMAIAAVPLGLAIDRYSRVRLLLLISILALVGSALTAVATAFPLMFSARCVAGLASLAVIPVAFSLVADLYAPAERGIGTMGINIGQSVGMAAAFGLGGALLSVAGSGVNAWRWAMFWLSIPLLAAVLCVLPMREPARGEVECDHPSSRLEWQELWRHRQMIAPMMIGVVLGQIALWADIMWAAPMLSRSYALTAQQVGVMMAIGLLVSGILGSIGGGLAADFCQRIGGARVTIVALSVLALLSAPIGLFALVPDALWATVLLALFITIANATAVMGTTIFLVVVPNELRGLCMAMLVTICVLVGNGLSPLLVSVLSSALGGPTRIGIALSLTCVTTSAAAAAAFALGRRHLPRMTVAGVAS